jgi:predicted nucleic acid-binding protein
LIALDTNILVYAASPLDTSGRHQAAIALLQLLGRTGAILPLPVFGELFNARRKKKFADVVMLLGKVEIWQDAFDCVAGQIEDYLQAAEISDSHKLQYFDALIIAIAARAGTTILLSEDMQDGLEVAGLRIINPFAAANETLLADYFGSSL